MFLSGMSGLDYNIETNEVKYTFAATIELCYYLRNLQLVLPHSFLANLVQSCISGSKSVSVINGKTSPGGSYQTYKNWLAIKGSTPLPCKTGVIDIFFDNIGKYIVKNYRVRVAKSKTAAVITTCLQIIVDGESSIQSKTELKPTRCFEENIKDVHSRMRDEIQESDEHFRFYRFKFIEHLLHISTDELDDEIDRISKEMAKTTRRICTNEECQKEYNLSKGNVMPVVPLYKRTLWRLTFK